MLLAISRIAVSIPPGVSSKIIIPSAPAFCASSMLLAIYFAVGDVITPSTLITLNTGFFSCAKPPAFSKYY